MYKQPTKLAERESIARQCCSSLKLTLPCVVDTLDNRVDAAHAAWPERLFVVDAEGRIAFAGGRGASGYKPEELERAG